MPIVSDPPVLPPDSPGSSVSSHFQNEYDDLIRSAVVLPNGNLQAKSARHQTTFVFEKSSSDRMNSQEKTKSDSIVNDLVDLSTTTAETVTQDIEIPRCHCDHRSYRMSSPLILPSVHSEPINDKMDNWYLDLKKNLMNEFDQLRKQYLEQVQQTAIDEKQAQAEEYRRLNEDIKTMRTMLIDYEHIIDQKEQTEQNLYKAVDLLYGKTRAYRNYYRWRLATFESQQENYELSLAKRFYEEKLKRKAISHWKSTVEYQWKQRFELACEKKSKAILERLISDYEAKYRQLEAKIRAAHDEITRLRSERTDHDEVIRKAFLRGVCALNMEAMGVLLKDQHCFDGSDSSRRE